jgi:PAS domain S-box-containing protein
MYNRKPHELTDVLDTLEDGIYVINNDYIIEFMNKAMVKVFGNGIGKKCHQVINRNDEVCPWCTAADVFEKGETSNEEVHLPALGKTYDLLDLPLRNKDGSISKLSIYRDITSSKDQEKRLRASEQNYRRLFENVGVGVYISSKKGRFLNANRALLDMLGYEDKTEFLGIDIKQDLYVNPEDRKKFQKMIERHGKVVDYVVAFKRKDGTSIPVLLTANVRMSQTGNILGYEGICVDQSQRQQMEKKLKEAYDFLDNTIQSSPNAIMCTDMNGNIIMWNHGAEETLGYKASDVIGKMNVVGNLYTGSMARKVMKMMRSDQYGGKGKLRSCPMTFKRNDGREVEGNLSASIIYDDKGNEIASVGFFVDLGEMLEMNTKLRRTQEQLLQSEKLAAMGRLTSQIAHELNNPLYGIMNTLELMKTEISPDNKRRKLLDMSLSETERLADMLRKMLSFSKPDQEERSPVNLNTILDEILLLHKKQLWEHTININATFDEALDRVYASKNQLRQVFLNIISNAKDAMPDGGTLTVTTASDTEHVRVLISDTGCGIQEKHLDMIFETFFTTKTDSVKGVGLGLSVCYGFIKDHGGDMLVESEPGQGTTFTIILPVYRGTSD